ncbi:hypothetical protein [Bacillus sp. 1P02SD]|uniref:hypothetical protein n=1 Tax=Bacillus sp. 1P02SD TaxID=3132264 RepID=UPI0039A3EC2F
MKELRERIFENRSYSNMNTIKRFQENFRFVDQKRLTYTKILDKPAIEWLIQMTPMTWSKKEEVTSFLNKESFQITIDFEILIGKNNL